jgi:hypothetical protein
VLPDKVFLSAALAGKLRAYLAAGGRVIASFRSGLTPDGERFALDEFGVELVGQSPFVPDYVVPREALAADLPPTEYVMYESGLEVRALAGTQVLADTFGPYFARTWDRFCSHRQTPPDLASGSHHPAVCRSAAGHVVYFANPVFAGYRQHAALWYKRMFLAALRQLLPDPLLTASAPSTAQVSLMRQTDPDRTIVHILHYIPERRGLEFDTVEDVIPLHDVTVRFRAPTVPRRVYLAPSGEALGFDCRDGYVQVTVREVRGHQMVVAE